MVDTPAEQRAAEFVERFKNAFKMKVNALTEAGPLTQKNLQKSFEDVSDQFQKTLQNHIDQGTSLAFSAGKTKLYGLVSLADEPITFIENNKEISFDPRILLWSGQESPLHSHPGKEGSHLAANDLACLYYTASPATEKLFDQIGKNWQLGQIRTLAVGKANADIKGEKEFGHTFKPNKNALPHISFIADGQIYPVHSVTFNLYNGAKKNEPAPSRLIEDSNPTLTDHAERRHTEWMDMFKLNHLVVRPSADNKHVEGSEARFADILSNGVKKPSPGSIDDTGFHFRRTVIQTRQASTMAKG